MPTIRIVKRGTSKSKRRVNLKATVRKIEEDRLEQTFEVEVTDEMYAALLELSSYPGGHTFDFLRIWPYRNYRKLEELGYIAVANRNGNCRWKVARLTDKGAGFVGARKTNRLRRRRRAR